jgi:hypothetical protein
VTKGKFSGGEQVKPTIGGEGDVSGREDQQEVVLGGPDGALGFIGAVVLGGNVLELGGGFSGPKEGGQGIRSLIVCER